MKQGFLLLLALCCLTTTVVAQDDFRLLSSSFTVPPAAVPGFHRFEIVQLDFNALRDLKADRVAFTLQTSRGKVDFDLNRWELRGADHALTTSGGKGIGQLVPRQPSAQFRGRTAEGNTAVFTLDKLFTKGRWRQDGEFYNLEPLWRLYPAAPRNLYLYYRDQDVKDLDGACATPASFHAGEEHLPSGNKAAGECFEVEIALAADFEMFQAFGDATSVENFMLGTLADVQTNYDDEFDDALQFVVVATEIATSNASDPWVNSTNPFELLPDFRNWGNNNGFGSGVAYDVASLWSDRDFDGSTVGLAYVGEVCTGNRYNVLQQFNTSATSMRVMWAHELGHNFGSGHDPDEAGDPVWIMSPFVSAATEWSPASTALIVDYYTNVSCLSNCPDPNPPVAQGSVFTDEVCGGSLVSFFDETVDRVDSRLWSFPGGSPASSTEAAPVITYPAPGTYQATLTVSNQFGQNQLPLQVVVATESVTATNVIFFENFEDDNLEVTIVNPDGQNTWFLAQADGNQGSSGIRVNNYDNNLPGETDVLQLPTLDLSDYADPKFEMEYAYQRYSSSLNDRLRVWANNGSGDVLLFDGFENGSQNFATGPDNQDRFVPKDLGDWCANGPGCISLPLAGLGDLSAVDLRIENINGYGNLMWVDNLAVTASCAASLPVEWLSFTARPQDKVSQLHWQVQQLPGHLGFTVERRSGEADWTELDWVPARSGTTDAVSYQYTDTEVVAGQTYYYRLRQRDADGTTSLSEVRPVTFSASLQVAVWPNPANDRLHVRLPHGNNQFSLFNALGQVLRQGRLTDGRASLDLHGLATGVYFLRLADEEVVRVVKR